MEEDEDEEVVEEEDEDERLHPILYDPRFQWEPSRPTPREILHDHIVCTATALTAEQFGAAGCCLFGFNKVQRKKV